MLACGQEEMAKEEDRPYYDELSGRRKSGSESCITQRWLKRESRWGSRKLDPEPKRSNSVPTTGMYGL